jgi:hypothetical protein
MEILDLNNVIEIKSIRSKITDKERDILDYIVEIANIRINNKGLDKPCPIEIEAQVEPVLSDHSSDEDYDIIDESD